MWRKSKPDQKRNHAQLYNIMQYLIEIEIIMSCGKRVLK